MPYLFLFVLSLFSGPEEFIKEERQLPDIRDPFLALSSTAGDTLRFTYLALGDSYTTGTSVQDSALWYPLQLVDSLHSDGFSGPLPTIIAANGWTTRDLLTATDHLSPDSSYDLVSLLIGVNNQFQGLSIDQYEVDFEHLLNRLIVFAGKDTSRIFVLSIPDYGVTPFAEDLDRKRIAMDIDAFNAVNQRVTSKYGISYFNITPISRMAVANATLIADDGLHPSGRMYSLWIDLLYSEIKSKLNE